MFNCLNCYYSNWFVLILCNVIVIIVDKLIKNKLKNYDILVYVYLD